MATRFDRPSSPRASIVVTGWRDAPHLLRCLSSIHDSQPSTSFEVIVSLNEPSQQLEATLSDQLAGAVVTISTVNRGFAGACNAAASLAGGEFVVLINDDAEVEQGWLDALVEAADSHPKAGAVGGRIVSFDGKAQEDGTVLWNDGTVVLIDETHRPRPTPAPGIRRVDYCSGASLLIRKQSWDDVGGMDEGYYPAYYEDVDLCLKIRALAQEVLYQPWSVLRHRQGASASLRYRVFLRDRNAERLVRRWSHVLADNLGPAPDDPAALARAIRLADERQPTGFDGPQIEDEPRLEETNVKEKELALLREYVSLLESRLGHDDARVLNRMRRLVRDSLAHYPPALTAARRLRTAVGRHRTPG